MSAYRKYAARTQQKYYEQFKRDTQGVLDCKLVPLDNLLSAPMTDLEMGPLCEAFVRWSTVVYQTKPGEGPHCLTCDTEFGPSRTAPAAFWFQFPFARRPTVMAVGALCPACFKRDDCINRIVAEARPRNLHLQVVPTMTTMSSRSKS